MAKIENITEIKLNVETEGLDEFVATVEALKHQSIHLKMSTDRREIPETRNPFFAIWLWLIKKESVFLKA